MGNKWERENQEKWEKNNSASISRIWELRTGKIKIAGKNRVWGFAKTVFLPIPNYQKN